MRGLAGAIMEDESGLMKVYAETTAVTAHFFENVQLSCTNEHVQEMTVYSSNILLRIVGIVGTFPIDEVRCFCISSARHTELGMFCIAVAFV